MTKKQKIIIAVISAFALCCMAVAVIYLAGGFEKTVLTAHVSGVNLASYVSEKVELTDTGKALKELCNIENDWLLNKFDLYMREKHPEWLEDLTKYERVILCNEGFFTMVYREGETTKGYTLGLDKKLNVTDGALSLLDTVAAEYAVLVDKLPEGKLIRRGTDWRCPDCRKNQVSKSLWLITDDEEIMLNENRFDVTYVLEDYDDETMTFYAYFTDHHFFDYKDEYLTFDRVYNK